MKLSVHVVIETDTGEEIKKEDVIRIQRGNLDPATLGLTLDETKELLAGIQEVMITQQAADYVESQRPCPDCGKHRPTKGHRTIVYRTLFGKLELTSPRLYTCSCQPQTKRSFSPLATLLEERTAPELLYLQTKWATLMSYGLTVDLLQEVLPIQASKRSVQRQVTHLAERLESELGDEQGFFYDGHPADWVSLPDPDGPIVVGIDGGFVREHGDPGSTKRSFEIIAGKSITHDGHSKCFSFVPTIDQKPKRRLAELLKSQGLQMNQQIIFISDGEETLQDLQLYISPESEHILDWFHITMHITVMKQMARSILSQGDIAHLDHVEEDLDSIKWFLWHGNVYKALQRIDWLEDDLFIAGEDHARVANLLTKLQQFHSYISANRRFITNYGERYRYGERISTGFAESTINQVISKRMVKKQQMRWSRQGAHLLLQIRTLVLNQEWRDQFGQWYPTLGQNELASLVA